MEYMDWVELGMNKRARKMTRQDVAEAMGFKGKGAASHKFKGRRDTTNKTADDVLKCSPQSVGKLSSSIATGRS